MGRDTHLEQDDAETRNGQRGFSELMEAVVEALPEQDRALVRLVYEHGAKVAMVATAAGVRPQTLYGRLRRVEKRVQNPTLKALWPVRDQIPPDARELIFRHLVGGESIEALAEEYEWPKTWCYQTLRTYREYAGEQQTTKRKKKR